MSELLRKYQSFNSSFSYQVNVFWGELSDEVKGEIVRLVRE